MHAKCDHQGDLSSSVRGRGRVRALDKGVFMIAVDVKTRDFWSKVAFLVL